MRLSQSIYHQLSSFITVYHCLSNIWAVFEPQIRKVLIINNFYILHRDFSLLDESERRYAENGLTHVDFLIYNKVGRQPVLVIETDGHQHHKEGSRQKERDIMKDRILELYGIPCERLKTTESNERERIETRLKDVLHIN